MEREPRHTLVLAPLTGLFGIIKIKTRAFLLASFTAANSELRTRLSVIGAHSDACIDLTPLKPTRQKPSGIWPHVPVRPVRLVAC